VSNLQEHVRAVPEPHAWRVEKTIQHGSFFAAGNHDESSIAVVSTRERERERERAVPRDARIRIELLDTSSAVQSEYIMCPAYPILIRSSDRRADTARPLDVDDNVRMFVCQRD